MNRALSQKSELRRDTHKENNAESFSIKIARSIEEVENMRSVWKKMRCSHNTDIDVYLNNLKFIKDSRPFVLMLSINKVPRTILVGRIVERSIDFKIGYRVLYSPRAGLLNILYGGVLGEDLYVNCELIINEIMDALKKGEADIVIMNFLQVDSDIYNLAKKKPGFFYRDYISDVKIHSKVELPERFAEYMQILKSKHKRYYNRHFYSFSGGSYKGDSPCRMFKKLQKEHEKVEIKCYREKNQVEQLCRDAEKVAGKTYQRGIGTGFYYDTERKRRAFFAERGWLRGYVLYVDDKPLAFWIGVVYKASFLSEFLGYDPEYKKYEPGTILLIRMIEDLCKDKVKELDFGVGEAIYKKRFGNHNWKEDTVYMFAPSFKGMKMNVARSATLLISRFAERIMNRFNLLDRMKRRWRDYSIQKLRRSKAHA